MFLVKFSHFKNLLKTNVQKFGMIENYYSKKMNQNFIKQMELLTAKNYFTLNEYK